MTYSGKYLPDFFRLSSMKLVGCGHFSHTLDHHNDDPDVHLSPPQRGKSSNCNDVRYGCLDGLRGDYHHSDHSHALYI